MLPECLFSYMTWWASAQPSKGKTLPSTGWIFFSTMSWFARLASYALQKCEPRIVFCRIQRYRTSKSRLNPDVAPQITILPKVLASSTLAGNVSCPTCSKTMSASPPFHISRRALPSRLVSEIRFFSCSGVSPARRAKSNSFRLTAPTAPRSITSFFFSSLDTIPIAFAPTSLQSWTAKQPKPPAAPHTSTLSPAFIWHLSTSIR